MGSNDIPPPHVPSTYHATCTVLLGSAGFLWTLTYVLMTQQSLRDRTYPMPIFALAFNFAWEIVFALYVTETAQEKAVFGTWMALDIGLMYTIVKYGANEWKHAPIVGRHIGTILFGCVLWVSWALWAVCVWWLNLDDPVNPKAGKIYRGVIGPDTTELGYWTTALPQLVLSVQLLAQIVVRGHSGGASYSIWATRFFGSLTGQIMYYGYCSYVWPEAHGYFISHLSICIQVAWVLADLAYLFVLRGVKRSEVVLKDGRKIRGSEGKCGMEILDSDDDDLRKAIAMSLEEFSAATVPPACTNSVVGLQADPETSDDDDVRKVMALSLESNGKTASSNLPSMQAVNRPSNSQGLAGLDRKAMEQERLARLGKRKKPASPEPPSRTAKQKISHSSATDASQAKVAIDVSNSPIQYPRGAIKRTWAFKHPRTNDIRIEEVVQSSTLQVAILSAFDWDVDWIFTKIDPEKVKQIWIMNAKGKGLQDKWRQDAADQNVPNLKMHFPPMAGPTQNMHSKLMLLFHPTHLRIAVPTANFNKYDWGETNITPRTGKMEQAAVMENSVFLIDLPRLPAACRREDLTWFGKELLYYLEAQNLGETSKNAVEGLLRFDFTKTRHLAFVHSIGGRHGPGAHWTGLPSLSSSLRRMYPGKVTKMELDYATSSLGALTSEFLKQVFFSSCGIFPFRPRDVTEDVSVNVSDAVRFYFPSQSTVEHSTGGVECGGTNTLNQQHFASSKFPVEAMYDYKSTRPGVRGTDKPFAWAYIGSANLTESAWGAHSMGNKSQHKDEGAWWEEETMPLQKGDKVEIRNWECGIIVRVPDSSLMDLKLETGEVPPMSVFDQTLEIPFRFPGEPFGDSEKKPWFFRSRENIATVNKLEQARKKA
ncbi:tyrosyl-DNA phosphodiesterase-domain-containing protein [Clohesyomyces aquaticus]|uniref:Tyrosyl-DNA phosphodiesterase-domain-containing protein n=1 Tax=Clohesyomyces aquaticus TaxID=1231657 RepID=A0A1Y1YNL8_9PLEO|nr:tyrosyl-DNA phosphodiesterase-domain-containing protein [Clohesyomyces aquaticus]